ncbi:P-loop containing nucleoside triphosphate hydrolase protein [Chiua virens]|nr:P-loop containing nucleoside triphosphate hydrolase protein [Chiua virens]
MALRVVQCYDPDGWNWISPHREFDLSLCAEQAFILSPLLAIFIIAALTHFPWSCCVVQCRRSRLHRRRSEHQCRSTSPCTRAPRAIPRLVFDLSQSPSNPVLLYHYPALLALLYHCLPYMDALIRGILSHHAGYPVEMRSYTSRLTFLCIRVHISGRHPQSNDESPILTANVFSIWSFDWMTPLLRKGAKVVITEDDLPALAPSDESTKLGNDLQRALERHTGLWTALFVAYGRPYLLAAFLKLIQDSLTFVQPALLAALLSYISDYQDDKEAGLLAATTPLLGYSLAILMFVSSMVQTIILHQYFQICMMTGMRIRAGLVTVIYNKALVLSSDERSRATGDIVNLMSVDATRIQDLCTYGLIAISGPYQITLAFVSLYNLLGWSAFVGVAIMILSTPLNAWTAQILKKMHEKQMKNRDKRTRLMSELLANIKSIKLYAWDYAFIRRVLHVRNDLELKTLRTIGIATAMNNSLWLGIPLVVAFCSFATASVFSARPLTADVIFPCISLFMLLQFPLGMFSQVMSNIVEALVSVKRLSDFLHANELQEDAVKRIEKRSLTIGDEVLSVRDGEFRWSKNDGQPALEGIDLTVRKGELVGILGRVGAGKSSLLSAVIGDMRKTEGEVVLAGSVAYAAQNPWILSATIRDNILFSHEYDESFYDLVIEGTYDRNLASFFSLTVWIACALKPDLAVLPQGDMTEVGEKGEFLAMLFGGQRARVALARAVYARADLILLDDVLAAVDAHVARHVFDNVIGPEGLLATKARVLVTNSIAFLKYFDQLVYIRRGIILECGSYSQLISDPDSAIRKLIQNHATNGSASGTTSGAVTPTPTSGSGINTPTSGDNKTQTALINEIDSVAEKVVRRTSFSKAVIGPLPSVRQVVDSGISKEHSEQGRVKKKVYLQYLQAVSKVGFYLFILSAILGQASSILSTFMLRLWGESNRESGRNTGLVDPYLLGYGVVNLATVVLGLASGLLVWVLCSLRSSKYLHDTMLESIMRAPLSFFETTPSGRILNLFSRDIYVVDIVLGRVVQNLVKTCASTVGILLVIGVSFPPFLFLILPLGWLYYRVTVYYLSTSRELKRLDAVSKSPIFAWFTESLSGLSTIRAYHQQHIFVAHNSRRLDRNQICFVPSISVNRWLAIRLDFVGSIIILSTAVLAVSAVVTSNVDAGLVGMVLSYALNTTGALNWLVRSASEVEQNVVSVERITHYANDIAPEAPRELPDSKPPAGWPGAGEVEFREYSMRYRPELDLVLKEISLTIKPKEKIGIVGRTGAGKSSLLLALFRILEAASGKILIDGVDISTIGLHDLRSVISIVPQSPDMFEGTLRENVDPVGEHPDADIWAALEHAHLKAYVESLPEGLDAPVQEGGLSLSAGQRQLLCFARALLRKSKVLVLDEATSAVDLDTDRAIQDIIRGPLFDDVTILTIAHRLNTIIESTRVLVLDHGRVAEFDAPEVLLADKTSRFYGMAFEAGLVQAENENGNGCGTGAEHVGEESEDS